MIHDFYWKPTRTAMDKETFEVMWRDSEPKENGAAAGYFFRHNQTEFRADGVDPSPWLDYMPEVSSSFQPPSLFVQLVT